MEHWPWYVSGLALASIPLIHWVGLSRSLAVSGRVTALVNRVRHGRADADPGMTGDELARAVREATIAAFGPAAVGLQSEAPAPTLAKRLSMLNHVVFLLAMAVGGFVSVWAAGGWSAQMTLRAPIFSEIFGGQAWVTALVLGGGGILVGFGTRMAAGCTTGHGLCGVSRFQKGSLVATAMFFGAGTLVSVGLEFLR